MIKFDANSSKKLKPTKKRTRASVPGQGKQLEYTYLNVDRTEQSQLSSYRVEVRGVKSERTHL